MEHPLVQQLIYDLQGWSEVLPLPFGITYYSYADFMYRLLTDPWIVRAWDLLSVSLALSGAIACYSLYFYWIESLKTFNIQASQLRPVNTGTVPYVNPNYVVPTSVVPAARQ